MAHGLTPVSPRPQVLPCTFRVWLVQQLFVVERDGPLHDAKQRLTPFSVGLVVAAGVVAYCDPAACCQALHGLDEVAALHIAQERDRVPGDLAPEAVVEAFLGVDRERSRLLGMKRAQADIAPANPLERCVLAYQGEDVGCGPDRGHVLVRNRHHLDGIAARAGPRPRDGDSVVWSRPRATRKLASLSQRRSRARRGPRRVAQWVPGTASS